jgi:hypothetical protein
MVGEPVRFWFREADGRARQERVDSGNCVEDQKITRAAKRKQEHTESALRRIHRAVRPSLGHSL